MRGGAQIRAPRGGLLEADVFPERCTDCGGRVEPSTDAVPVALRGETISVAGIAHERCERCGRVRLDPEGTELLRQAAVAQLRAARGLLTPADIMGLRGMLGLSQAGLEKLLGTGPKTVVRWEKGTVFQSVTADRLMRLLIAHPGLAAQLPGYEPR
jgi:HTH-type transcriptional regulator/antitoxin MqsA